MNKLRALSPIDFKTNCDASTSNVPITRDLLEIQELGPQPRLSEWETLRMGPMRSVCHSPPGARCRPKLVNHCRKNKQNETNTEEATLQALVQLNIFIMNLFSIHQARCNLAPLLLRSVYPNQNIRD